MENTILVKFFSPTIRKISLLGFFILVVVFLIFLTFLVFWKTPLALAYEVETHSFLTNESLRFYNQNFPQNPISEGLKPFLLDGSQHEDNPPRYLNHFFDPIYNRGLTNDVLGTWQKSKDWAKDQDNQNKMAYKTPTLIASVLDSIQQLKISLVSSETDFTWQKAVSLYNQGQKEKSFYLLGHILHLVQDVSVPDHTRNDAHPSSSPYESYARQYILTNPDKNIRQRLQNKIPIILDSLESYFDDLANYSNNNFYSGDTIEGEEYELPKPDYVLQDGKFFYAFKENQDNGKYKLFVYKRYYGGLLDENNEKEIVLTVPEDGNKTMSDYWSLLSPKSIQYSAGILDLFLRTATAGQTSNLKESLFDQTVEISKELTAAVGSAVVQVAQEVKTAAVNAVSGAFNLVTQVVPDLVSNVSGIISDSVSNVSNLTSNLASNLTGGLLGNDSQNNWQLVAETETGRANQTELIPGQPGETNPVNHETSKPVPCPFSVNQTPHHQKVLLNEIAWMGTTNSYFDEWIELKNVSGSPLNLEGYQLVDQKEQIRVVLSKEDKVSTTGFFLLERTDETTIPPIPADKLYKGSLSNSGEGLRLFGPGCVLVDEVLAPAQWPGGNNTTKQTMERNLNDFDWQTSSVINGTPKKENSALAPGLAGASVPAVASASVSVSNQTSTKTQNQSSASAPPSSSSSPSSPVSSAPAPMIYYVGGGGVPVVISQSSPEINQTNQTNSTNSATSTVSATSSPSQIKILISEIQISPIGSRFIELYNPNNEVVDLTDWYIQRKTQTGSEFGSCISNTHFSGKTIPVRGYFLISRASSTEADIVSDGLTLTAGNALRLRNSQMETVDLIGWAEATEFEGSAPAPSPLENSSIQRKFGDGSFIDTDNNVFDFEIQNCPSPKAQSRSCSATSTEQSSQSSSQSSQPPSAFFVYAPEKLLVGETISFNAASSTVAAGNIALFQWDFGDGQTATTTQPIIEHSFALLGDFSTRLTIFDGQNNSASIVSVLSVSKLQHIVISEIQPGLPGKANNEFVELYNPLNQPVNLAGWSLKRRISPTATTTQNLVLNFPAASSSIPAKGFLLLAHQEYSGLVAPDLRYTNNSDPLAYEDETIVLEDRDGSIIDEVVYAEIPSGKTWERKANASSTIDSLLGGGDRFAGNGYDSDVVSADSAADFVLRETPEPQNSFSFPEPRTAPPAVSGLNIQAGSSIAGLVFNWQATQDYNNSSDLIYKVSKMTDVSSTVMGTTTSTIWTTFVDELGRDYQFSVQAFDRDGLGSALASSTVFAPSFLSNLRFYRNPLNPDEDLIELYYDHYPFVPDLFHQGQGWKIAVFYLNNEAEKQPFIGGIISGWTYKWPDETLNKIIKLRLNVCSGGDANHREMLILPDIAANCNVWGGVANSSLNFSELEDNHLLIKASGVGVNQEWLMPDLDANDYLTVAFYSFSGSSRWSGGADYFQLAAVDKTRYYYQKPTEIENKNLHFPPETATSSLSFSFDENSMKLNIFWKKFYDPDTLDGKLKYEISWDEGANWKPASYLFDEIEGYRLTYELIAESGKTYSFWVRATDEWGLTEMLTGGWKTPTAAKNEEL